MIFVIFVFFVVHLLEAVDELPLGTNF